MPGRPKTRARKLTALEKAANDISEAVNGSIPDEWVSAWCEGRFATSTDEERYWRKACDASDGLRDALRQLAEAARKKAGFPVELLFNFDDEEEMEKVRSIGLERLPIELWKLNISS
ncbi:MAG: hypothetical protein HZB38_06180 [Planctomycetes bacterium]|nr:hypothetical protein [Planctomycetota bacterium]